jgi:hypothetical protein
MSVDHAVLPARVRLGILMLVIAAPVEHNGWACGTGQAARCPSKSEFSSKYFLILADTETFRPRCIERFERLEPFDCAQDRRSTVDQIPFMVSWVEPLERAGVLLR